MSDNINFDKHHHIFVRGETKFSWDKAHFRALHYYNELKKNEDQIVSSIATLFFNQIESEGLYSIFRERYEEEFGMGRSGKPLPYYEGDFHCALLLNPSIYIRSITEKLKLVNTNDILEALSRLGPICSMASISHISIKTVTHQYSGYNEQKLIEFGKTHWQVREYLKDHLPVEAQGIEMLKMSRMQTPSKILDGNENLKKYSYRELGFGTTLVSTAIFVSSLLFPEEKYIYLHARAGSLKPTQEGVVDKNWVVPFYEKLGGKWIKTFDEYFAFENSPFLNIVMRLSIVKNTGKLDHILLINDK